jgi:predicted Zn-dependent protease
VSFTHVGLAVTDVASGRDALWPYADIGTGAPVTKHTRDVLVTVRGLPGVTVFVEDTAFASELARRVPSVTASAFRKAGLMPGLAVGAAGVLAFATASLLEFSPSKAVARLMPEAARVELGERVLRTLPSRTPCTESAAGRAALNALTVRLLPGVPDAPRRVRVLDWPIVNAFAVPGGTVILTRGVLQNAASADELAGILAHEIGHGLELHPEAGLVRSVGLWALIQMVFTGTPGAVGNAGALLAQLAYNRAYEREADAVAVRLLREAKISPKGFAGFFKRMEGLRRPGGAQASSPVRDMLDTHPSTPERIRAIEQLTDYPATPALTGEQWTALRSICSGDRPLTPPAAIPAPAPATPEESLRAANARVAAQPNQAAVWYERGEVHMGARRFPDAVRDFTKATDLEPGNAHYWFRRGAAHQDQQRFREAAADYSEAVRLNPRHAQALAGRGAVRRVTGETQGAYADFAAALGINPRQQYALYQRGLLHHAQRRFSDAARDFGSVIEVNRAYAYAYVRRGEAFEASGQRDRAIADYRAALAASPSSPDAQQAFEVARERLRALGVRG